ncbi:MAG TPA: hypothetical protein VF533_00435 [Solirubrobacteraceae bacterium]|jgi:hypothetical protein
MRILKRITSAHLIASIALFVSLGGGAYAAAKIGSKDIKKSAVRSKHIKNHTIGLRDISRKTQIALRGQGGNVGPAGPRGPAGLKGATGKRGKRGLTGKTGPQGPPGPYPEALPAGKTVRGTYAATGTVTAAGQAVEAGITYPIALGAVPAVHFVSAGTPVPPECPGDPANPGAAPGHLCVFESEVTGPARPRELFDPSRTDAAGKNAANRFGFGVRVISDNAAAVGSQGTWAVTAP